MNTSLHRALKTTAATVATAALLAFGASAASAHVKVAADDPAAGGYTHLTFNVPNESPAAKTSKVQVTLPTDTPFTSVSVKPLEGWTEKVITSDLPKPVTIKGSTVTKAVSSIVWTADAAHQLGQNQYQAFSLSVGVLPAAGTTVTLPATQTYTDGSIVKWDQKASDGQAEPEHPAPSFVTTAEDGAAPSTPAASDPATAQASSQATADQIAPAASTTSTNTNSTPAWIGLIAGLLGLIAGITALIRTRTTQKR
ncbi:YcnI family protein [Paenarthrobacter sp. Z7-10]|uniref:YcnI family copper-binding membrane protein n=1 Tax=Paenarthrobacter sp. Z7-10 TaxID=2787635 RepID=UPI0022A98EEA|nr:YcnI family protein [Paenarthrobacter sp. Z7-10]MCZ2404612.1 YcnI family protein [Paenarthrobacter sp. Z7-10]